MAAASVSDKGDMEYSSTKSTYDSDAHLYAKAYYGLTFWKAEYRTFLGLLGSSGRIIDVGCGPGRDTEYFTKLGYDTEGIDYSAPMLSEAKRLAPGCKFTRMDMRSIKFPHGSFDAAWSCMSILHIKKADAGAVLDGICKVLKPGGVLFISVKNGSGEHFDKRLFSNYREPELRGLVGRHGFRVEMSYLNKKDPRQRIVCIFARKA